MSTSRRRKIPDAGTPTISYCKRGRFNVHVAPCGKPAHTVTFEMSYWQFRNFAKDVRAHARSESTSLKHEADLIIAQTTDVS